MAKIHKKRTEVEKINVKECTWYDKGLCLAHLAEARCFKCVVEREPYPCMDYKKEKK